jgi:hypothetical protein
MSVEVLWQCIESSAKVKACESVCGRGRSTVVDTCRFVECHFDASEPNHKFNINIELIAHTKKRFECERMNDEHKQASCNSSDIQSEQVQINF